jgi:hypothetical protein
MLGEHFQKPPLVQLFKEFPNLVETEGSLPCSKEHSTGHGNERGHSSATIPYSLSLRSFFILFTQKLEIIN